MSRHLHHVVGSVNSPHHSGPNPTTGGWSPIRAASKELSAETKWEICLRVTGGAIAQADAARKWGVDVSTVITIRRAVKDAALAGLSRRPGRPAAERNWGLEEAQAEIGRLTEAVKAQAIELAIVRGESGWD